MDRTATNRSLPNRMVRASQFDGTLYEEVERDVDATSQAAIIVAIVAVMTGIGRLRDDGIIGLLFGVIAAFVGWVLWAAITYWVGKTIFKTENTRVTLGEMLRTLGFAQSPGVLNILGIIPGLGILVVFVVRVWQLALGIVAIRSAMDFSTGRAIGTALVGWLIATIVAVLLFALGARLA